MATQRSYGLGGGLGDLMAVAGKPKDGFAALGQALAGGDAYAALAQQHEQDRQAELYERQMAGQKSMEEATRLHSTNQARTQMVPIVQGFVNSGDLPPDTDVQGTSEALLAMDKLDPAQLGDFVQKLTNVHRGNVAIQAFGNHDPNTANANLAAVSGRPMETTKIEGGMALNPYTAPDQPMSLTPVGQADVGEKNAQASHASAGAFLDRIRAGMESNKAPTVQEFYDPGSGRSYKAEWDAPNQRWNPIGGMKAAGASGVAGHAKMHPIWNQVTGDHGVGVEHPDGSFTDTQNRPLTQDWIIAAPFNVTSQDHVNSSAQQGAARNAETVRHDQATEGIGAQNATTNAYRANTTADQGAQRINQGDVRLSQGQERINRMGSHGGLTAAQLANNQEVQAARDAMRGLGASREEIQRRSQPKDPTGRPNPDYDPYIGRVVAKALQRKTGDDPEFESLYSQVYGGGSSAAVPPVTPAAPAAPIGAASPDADTSRPPGLSDVQLYNAARASVNAGKDKGVIAGRLRRWGLDPSKVQGLQ